MRDPVLVKKYRVLDHDLAEFSDQMHGGRAYETVLFIPDKAHKEIMQAKLNALKKRVDEIEAPDAVFEILKIHFQDFLEAQQMRFENAFSNPSRTFRFLSYMLSHSERDSRDDTLKADILRKKVVQVPLLWDALVAECTEPQQFADLYRGCVSLKNSMEIYLPDLPKAFPTLSEAELTETIACVEDLQKKLDGWMESIKEKADSAPDGVKVSEGQRPESAVLPQDIEKYRQALRVNMGVDLDELLEWHEAEIEKTRNECLAIAAKLNVPEAPAKNMREVNDILFKYAGPADSPEEMYDRARTYLKRARAAAHEYVWLPEDEQCEVRKVPVEIKGSYPWGGYGGGCTFRRPMLGGFFLNNFNYKAITDGWIKINCLHEAYPGHHVQWIRRMTDPIPETFKIGAKNVPLGEGTCIRTERAFEFVFAEDPYYPLFVAYRRHHGSVRIKVDLYLRYFGKTIGDAVALYEDELGFDHNTARMQVQSHENDYGYFTSYYYGLKKLEDWERLYGYDKKTFTGLLFDVGQISIENFERFLKLSEEDKYSLTHDFASLYDQK